MLNKGIVGFADINYKMIFVDIAERLFVDDLISDDEKIKLVNIINMDVANTNSFKGELH